MTYILYNWHPQVLVALNNLLAVWGNLGVLDQLGQILLRDPWLKHKHLDTVSLHTKDTSTVVPAVLRPPVQPRRYGLKSKMVLKCNIDVLSYKGRT